MSFDFHFGWITNTLLVIGAACLALGYWWGFLIVLFGLAVRKEAIVPGRRR